MTVEEAAPSPPWQRMLREAQESGWQPALGAFHTEAGHAVLMLGPRGHALAPFAIERRARRLRLGCQEWLRDRAAEDKRDVGVPGLAALRARVPDGPGKLAEERSWSTALAGLRLGLSYRMLEAALSYLDGRRSGDVALLRQQMVKADVADIVIQQLQVRCALDGASVDGLSSPALTDLHRQITDTDLAVLRLLGASGYLEDGPGTTAHVSELLADAYAGPAEGSSVA
jgi:hypothetical protein